MTETHRKMTLSSRIAEELLEAILSGALAPGQKINLDRLRKELEVSISPLREAVSRLVATGLVQFQDQLGYSVAPMSDADLHSIVELREQLEPMAMTRAIAQGSLDWESEVMAALHLFKANAALTSGSSVRRFILVLLAPGMPPRLRQIVETLHLAQERYRRAAEDHWPQFPKDMFETLAHAAVQRDTPQSVEILRELIHREAAIESSFKV
ncbi:GntR family transcriptional regulator [Thioclava pacifica]|uniref:HTH gntR-type domain-containing protein n=1 Tax=Thioclava pacifica DSM 10166 TaxID=1353537 RepID=A0A074JIK0_9RHOB|nr:GntR family transcriptional regulator [Thioclava pacifica]KEO55428.1 hypothetical protein TP2_15415 [Thioclava pacifica DSM 10166]